MAGYSTSCRRALESIRFDFIPKARCFDMSERFLFVFVGLYEYNAVGWQQYSALPWIKPLSHINTDSGEKYF